MVSLEVSSRKVKGYHLWVCQVGWKQQSGIKCGCPKVIKASPTQRSAPSVGSWVPQIRASGTSHFNEPQWERKMWGGYGLRTRAVSSSGWLSLTLGRSCAMKGNQDVYFALKTPPSNLMERSIPKRCQPCLSIYGHVPTQRQHPETTLLSSSWQLIL